MPVKKRPELTVHPRRPRGRPKLEDLPALEARLIHVAMSHFMANGYGATSMASIARAARVSKDTLYSRFSSKAVLFRAIVKDQIAGVQDALPHGEIERQVTLEETLRIYGNR